MDRRGLAVLVVQDDRHPVVGEDGLRDLGHALEHLAQIEHAGERREEAAQLPEPAELGELGPGIGLRPGVRALRP